MSGRGLWIVDRRVWELKGSEKVVDFLFVVEFVLSDEVDSRWFDCLI